MSTLGLLFVTPGANIREDEFRPLKVLVPYEVFNSSDFLHIPLAIRDPSKKKSHIAWKTNIRLDGMTEHRLAKLGLHGVFPSISF